MALLQAFDMVSLLREAFNSINFSSVVDPDLFWSAGSGSALGMWIRILIQEGKNDLQK
jgi:hypothetical protein